MSEQYGTKVRDLLPANFNHMDEIAKHELSKNPAQADFPNAVWQVVGTKATEHIQNSLDLDIFGIFARGWCGARELRKCADDTLKQSGKDSTFFLGEHPITTKLYPVVTVSFGNFKSPPLKFTLELTATIRTAALTLRDGNITAIANCDGLASAQLKYGEFKLHDPLKSKNVKLPGVYKFKEPGWAIASQTRSPER